MTDESSSPRDRAAEQADARRVAVDAIKALEEAAVSRGFHEGFMAGWRAGQKHIREMMEKAVQPSAAVSPVPREMVLFPGAPITPPVRAADAVLDIIRQHPGIRGVDIVKAAEDAGQPILERTVRTALYRMKRDGRIKNLEGGWFAADAAPENANASDGGQDGAQT